MFSLKLSIGTNYKSEFGHYVAVVSWLNNHTEFPTEISAILQILVPCEPDQHYPLQLVPTPNAHIGHNEHIEKSGQNVIHFEGNQSSYQKTTELNCALDLLMVQIEP